MAKLGRNEPCHCQSGKKYKACCLDKDAADASARIAKEAEQRRIAYRDTAASAHGLMHDWQIGHEDDGLATASNNVVDLANAGKLDQAEAQAQKLLRDFPDAVDGIERLAMIREKRGDSKAAAEMYRKALAFITNDPDDADEGSRKFYVNKIAKLDSQTA